MGSELFVVGHTPATKYSSTPEKLEYSEMGITKNFRDFLVRCCFITSKIILFSNDEEKVPGSSVR